MTTDRKIRCVVAGLFVGIGFMPVCAYVACTRVVKLSNAIGHEALDILIPAANDAAEELKSMVVKPAVPVRRRAA
jgi:hypothetical protein